MTYSEALREGEQYLCERGVADAGWDARQLMEFAAGADTAHLLLCRREAIPADVLARFQGAIKRRGSHEPLQHITGEAYFYGMPFHVTPDVLIPRPETEILAEQAAGRIRGLLQERPRKNDGRQGAKRLCGDGSCREVPRKETGAEEEQGEGAALSVLDLCTGSGCIAVALAKQSPRVHVTASDISEAALALARGNAARHGAAVEFVKSDLFEQLAGNGRFDLIVSNPPYIPTAEIAGLMEEVRDYDPLRALDGGGDGLLFYRKIIPGALSFLAAGGWLLLEIGHNQAREVAELMACCGYERICVLQDLEGHDRIVEGRNHV